MSLAWSSHQARNGASDSVAFGTNFWHGRSMRVSDFAARLTRNVRPASSPSSRWILCIARAFGFSGLRVGAVTQMSVTTRRRIWNGFFTFVRSCGRGVILRRSDPAKGDCYDKYGQRPSVIYKNVRRIVLQKAEQVLDTEISAYRRGDEAHRKQDDVGACDGA